MGSLAGSSGLDLEEARRIVSLSLLGHSHPLPAEPESLG